MEEKSRLQYLLDQLVANAATGEELDELLQLADRESEDALMRDVRSRLQRTEAQPAFDYDKPKWMAVAEGILDADKLGAERTRVRALRRWGRVAAAAVLIICVAGIYSWYNRRSDSTAVAVMQEISQGKEGAILKLADGSEVLLDTVQNGIVALQGGVAAKVRNGMLMYEGNSDDIVYNTMYTPKGRQFHLTLPDGTKVWLNAASSIRFPTNFAGGERRVAVTGEVYFEVTKDVRMPFRVDAAGRATVEVLGTSFNIKAYENETILKTTLLEGAVRIGGKVLKPGQQARLGDTLRIVDDMDLDKVMAWKNGFFNFEGASLDEVMRELERWYDIEVVYDGRISDIRFVGGMTKDIPLSGVLLLLEKSNVHFRLEGRKLTILP